MRNETTISGALNGLENVGTLFFSNERKRGSGRYRYGFNGKENDPETGTQDYGFRIYNPSICRFLSVDPLTKKYPTLTPYQFASNSPICAVDLDGAEAKIKIFTEHEGNLKLVSNLDVKQITNGRVNNGYLGDGTLTLILKKIDVVEGDKPDHITDQIVVGYSWVDKQNKVQTNKVTLSLLESGNPRAGFLVEGGDGGVVPFEQGMAILGGTAAVCSGGASIAAEGTGVALYMGIASLVSGADDIFANKKGESLIVGAMPNNKLKSYASFGKALVGLASRSFNVANMAKDGVNIANALNLLGDSYGVVGSAKSGVNYAKKANKENHEKKIEKRK